MPEAANISSPGSDSSIAREFHQGTDVHCFIGEALASTEIGKADHKRRPADPGTRLAKQCGRSQSGTPRREQIVDDRHLLSIGNG